MRIGVLGIKLMIAVGQLVAILRSASCRDRLPWSYLILDPVVVYGQVPVAEEAYEQNSCSDAGLCRKITLPLFLAQLDSHHCLIARRMLGEGC
jgi:hypothetical protein